MTSTIITGSPTGRGYKRERDREDKERERPRRFDPRHAADPEQPMQFNEEKMKGLVTSKFVPPSDSSTITLDPCELLLLTIVVCVLIMCDICVVRHQTIPVSTSILMRMVWVGVV